MIEDVTVVVCSRANDNRSFRVGKADLEVGGGKSATTTSKSRLRRIEEATLIKERPVGSMGGMGVFGLREVLINCLYWDE